MTLPAPETPPDVEPDPGHDLATLDGYRAELVRMRRMALSQRQYNAAERFMSLLGRTYDHFAQPDAPDAQAATDVETILALIRRMIARGEIRHDDLLPLQPKGTR